MDINTSIGLVSCKLHHDIHAYVAVIAVLQRQDLSCMYLAHHELESVSIMIIINVAAATGVY